MQKSNKYEPKRRANLVFEKFQWSYLVLSGGNSEFCLMPTGNKKKKKIIILTKTGINHPLLH